MYQNAKGSVSANIFPHPSAIACLKSRQLGKPGRKDPINTCRLPPPQLSSLITPCSDPSTSGWIQTSSSCWSMCLFSTVIFAVRISQLICPSYTWQNSLRSSGSALSAQLRRGLPRVHGTRRRRRSIRPRHQNTQTYTHTEVCVGITYATMPETSGDLTVCNRSIEIQLNDRIQKRCSIRGRVIIGCFLLISRQEWRKPKQFVR